MKAAGIKFICNADVGKDISGKELEKEYDRDFFAAGPPIREISRCPAGMQKASGLRWIFWEL